MRIFTQERLKEYGLVHPEAMTAIRVWVSVVKRAQWKDFADIRSDFNAVDAVGNGHYVFNLKGNDYRIVSVIRFQAGFVYIRFIGTHAEYSKIKDCSKL